MEKFTYHDLKSMNVKTKGQNQLNYFFPNWRKLYDYQLQIYSSKTTSNPSQLTHDLYHSQYKNKSLDKHKWILHVSQCAYLFA